MKWLILLATLFGAMSCAGAANALDCSEESAKDYRVAAICHSPKLLQADRDLNDAYQKLYNGRPKDEQVVLVHMQREWLLGDREAGCSATKDHSVDEECLYNNMQRRIDFFRSADGTGPSTQGRLVFKGYYLPKKKDSDISIEVSVFEFAEPDSVGKKAFNKYSEDLLGDGNKHGTDDNQGDESCTGSCEETIMMSQPFQSGGFISTPIDSSEYTGGAHGLGGTSYENRRLNKQELLSFADMFPEYYAAEVAKLCWEQVAPDGNGPSLATDGNYTLDGKEYPPFPSDNFMKAFKDPAGWSFDGKAITVIFGEQELGAYQEGVQSCVLPYDTISQFSRLSPLPGSPEDLALQARMRERTEHAKAPGAK
ncbi:lysozyme inhibitor LprI family protein [Rhizobium sp. AP16]|uniref:lysozyme inhibitor LprI family protein n=1 Tax=Rhizobium sp. AP16 TaxID=1144306 RepID=UPI00026ECBA2|nr:lysozyme inhibitor LprI family protein [Rhizobium sp. AP16]EJK87292.1 hypothetical protein PMI03_01303 [Rhizobium sp. AP16]NTG73530.1 DUF1311 domain-containing protein [Rhizobium rhizogenes]